jgi:hypothetical protein
MKKGGMSKYGRLTETHCFMKKGGMSKYGRLTVTLSCPSKVMQTNTYQHSHVHALIFYSFLWSIARSGDSIWKMADVSRTMFWINKYTSQCQFERD